MNDSAKDFSGDPRLTAYALGELEGAERAEVEALVRSRPAAAAAVEEIRRLAGSLTDALKEEAIELRPAAEIVSIESGRPSLLRRLPPYFYVASGLAAGWATALLIFRPTAPRPQAESAVAPSIPQEEKFIAASPRTAPSPLNFGAQPENVAIGGFSGGNYTPRPNYGPKGNPLPPVQPPAVAGALIDSAQLRDDLKHFELVQPTIGAGKRIALESKPGDHAKQTVDSGTIVLSPFEVTSDKQDYYTANTLAGTRLNSKLSDLGGQIQVVSKEQMLSYADDSLSAKTISGATIPAGIPALPAPAGQAVRGPTFGEGAPATIAPADSAHGDAARSPPFVYGRAELLPLAGVPGSAAPPSPPQTLAGTQMGDFAAKAGGLPATDWAPDPLRPYKDQLRALKTIDGTQAGQPALPGQFAQLYPTFLMRGSPAAYKRMMADPNPAVSAMGALCLMTVAPAERAAVLAKMDSDLRSITYVHAGSSPQASTLGALFQSIGLDPNFLFALGPPPGRP